MFNKFNIDNINLTKYLFFTGKGGVGKTSTACAVALNLSDSGKNIMLVSTDPASNLQDVFNTNLNNKGTKIKETPNLTVANFEPEQAAKEYRESVIDPYRGKFPESVLKNMEEDEVVLKMTSGISPCVIEENNNENAKYLVLPVRLMR